MERPYSKSHFKEIVDRTQERIRGLYDSAKRNNRPGCDDAWRRFNAEASQLQSELNDWLDHYDPLYRSLPD